MSAGGYIGQGARLGYSSVSPASYTSLGQLMEIPGIILDSDTFDNTVHYAGNFQTEGPAMHKLVPLHVVALADLDQAATYGAMQEAVRVLAVAQTTLIWRIEYPVARTQTNYRGVEFQGFIKGYQQPLMQKEGLKFEFDIIFSHGAAEGLPPYLNWYNATTPTLDFGV